MSADNQNSKNAVIIAIVAVIGTLGSALLANWDKVFQKPAPTPSISPTPSSSPSIPPIKPSPSPSISPIKPSPSPSPLTTLTKLEPLQKSLSERNWVEADLITDLLHPKSLSCSELLSVNKLWLSYSNNNFGYSVQRKIWEHKNLNGKYGDFAEFVGWKHDERYAVNIQDSILNTTPDSPAQAPLGHLPFNGWQVRGAVREDFHAFMLRLKQCKI